VFIDEERSLEIKETLVVPRTNYDSQTCAPGDSLDSILRHLRYPSHAVAVQPFTPEVPERPIVGEQERSDAPIFKGIRNLGDLERAIAACALASTEGRALLIPDMRAHMNPTRMAMIRLAASKLEAHRFLVPGLRNTRVWCRRRHPWLAVCVVWRAHPAGRSRTPPLHALRLPA
jgi:hypothetical protein